MFFFFDCKCKSFKRLGTTYNKQKTSFEKNRTNRNTGYPAQDPTANIYHIFIRGCSWAGYPVSMY